MSQPRNLDRHGVELAVGDVVTYADRDELHGGTIVYIAPAKIAEIVIENKQGLVIRYGEVRGPHVDYDHVVARKGSMTS